MVGGGGVVGGGEMREERERSCDDFGEGGGATQFVMR